MTKTKKKPSNSRGDSVNFLADENVDKPIVERLRKDGFAMNALTSISAARRCSCPWSTPLELGCADTQDKTPGSAGRT